MFTADQSEFLSSERISPLLRLLRPQRVGVWIVFRAANTSPHCAGKSTGCVALGLSRFVYSMYICLHALLFFLFSLLLSDDSHLIVVVSAQDSLINTSSHRLKKIKNKDRFCSRSIHRTVCCYSVVTRVGLNVVVAVCFHHTKASSPELDSSPRILPCSCWMS